MTKIVLDAESFKALASDTRLQILKALDARPLTVSELSRLLDLNKATVFEHLKQLMTAELAKREDDPARKWVYYRLTWKGKNVLHPENAQIFLMLGMAALGVGSAVLHTAYLARLWLESRGSTTASEGQQDLLIQNSAPDASPQPASGSSGGTATTSPQTANDESRGQPIFEMKPGAGDEGSSGGDAWWEPLRSTQFALVAAILVFLGLLTLIIWTLYGDQRRERLQLRGLIDKLPSTVNEGEERGV